MSEIKKLIKKIEKEIENKEEYLIRLSKKSNFQSAYFDTLQDINKLKAKLDGIKEGLEALKKDLIKNKPCPNKHPLIAVCYEQVIDDINKILEGEK